MELPTLSVVIYWFHVYDCLFCAHSTNRELPMHRHNASRVLPHCIVLRPRYCLDRVTPSRVNVFQLKDCKWNCQMNWAIAVVSRKLLIMISFDRTGKFSIVTKKRNHSNPKRSVILPKTQVPVLSTMELFFTEGGVSRLLLFQCQLISCFTLNDFFFRCTEVLRSYRSKKLAEKKNLKSSYIFFTYNVQL